MDANAPHYTVLARRFRPQTFSQVAGQAHIAQSLKNAIAAGRVAHAYLFTGARGVGKTSTARILAKALNCPRAVEGDPCNACEICEGIASGHDVDVIEIDGASNRRIDDIRMLRSNVGVKPMRSRYKIYIIDEVHMLTNEAINALLKTLEEPPPNVKFIFCTTEPSKLPDTILSRCQRFDFMTIDERTIAERLREIAAAEGCTVEPDALELVARRAGGSMRDSQSLFDQLLAYGDQSITARDVHRLLGTAPDDRLIALAESIVGGLPGRALELFDAALSDGVQLGEIADQILDYLRDLMVLAAEAQTSRLQSVAAGNRPQLADQARRWGMATILAGMQLAAETKTRMQRSAHGRALVELALVRMALLDQSIDLVDVIADLKLARGTNSTAATGDAAARTPAASAPRQVAVSRSVPVQDTSGTLNPAEVRETRRESTDGNRPGHTPVSLAPEGEFPLTPGGEAEFWSQLVSKIGDRDILRDALGKVANVATSGPNALEIVFPDHYHFGKELCDQPAARGRLEAIAQQLAGRPVRIVCRLDGRGREPGMAERPSKPVPPTADRRSTPAVGDAYTEQARAVFGATIVRVEELPRIAKTGGDESASAESQGSESSGQES